jgi:hypothetical protein
MGCLSKHRDWAINVMLSARRTGAPTGAVRVLSHIFKDLLTFVPEASPHSRYYFVRKADYFATFHCVCHITSYTGLVDSVLVVTPVGVFGSSADTFTNGGSSSTGAIDPLGPRSRSGA